MQTVFDWVTIAIFAGLIVLFLQRSVGQDEEEQRKDPFWLYLPPSIGLAVANQVGNGGQDAIAWAMIIGVCIYIQLVLKAFSFSR